MEDATIAVNIEEAMIEMEALSPLYDLDISISAEEMDELLKSPQTATTETNGPKTMNMDKNYGPDTEVEESRDKDIKRPTSLLDEDDSKNKPTKKQCTIWERIDTARWTRDLEKSLNKNDSFQTPLQKRKERGPKARLSREINNELRKLKQFSARLDKETQSLGLWLDRMSELTEKQQSRLRASITAEQNRNREIKDLKVKLMMTDPTGYTTRDIENM
jgi:hypothetical protein